MAKARQDIPADSRDPLLKALAACPDAYQRRNRVVHDAWARRAGGLAVTLRSHRQQADMTVTARTLPELQALAHDLATAADNLAAAATAALGAECLQLENQVRLEQGHDIGTDTGRS